MERETRRSDNNNYGMKRTPLGKDAKSVETLWTLGIYHHVQGFFIFEVFVVCFGFKVSGMDGTDSFLQPP